MHESSTKDMIKTGVTYILKLINDKEDKQKIEKSIAWLLGYVSHVVVDTTIHPIVNCINKASYEADPAKHLICEMHQDSFIFNELLKLSTDKRASFLNTGAGECHGIKTGFKTTIDSDIFMLWSTMLNNTFKDQYDKCPPEIDSWFDRFVFILGKGAEFASRFAYLRNNCTWTKGKTFPEPHEIDPALVYNIQTPNNKILSYSNIFDEAAKNTIGVWKNISDVLFIDQSGIDKIIDNWNLMTGNLQNGTSVFWGQPNEQNNV